MRARARFIRFVLTVYFGTLISDLTAQEVIRRTPAPKVSVPDAKRREGAGHVTGPELNAVSVQSPKAAGSSVVRIRMRENGRMLVPVTVNGSGT